MNRQEQIDALYSLGSFYANLAVFGSERNFHTPDRDEAFQLQKELLDWESVNDLGAIKRQVLRSGYDAPTHWLTYGLKSVSMSGPTKEHPFWVVHRDAEDMALLESLASEIAVARMRLECSADPSESGDTGDTFGDTRKKTKKKIRPPRVEYSDCERIYQDYRKARLPKSIPSVAEEYLENNPDEHGNPRMPLSSLIRGWKDYRKMLRNGDK